MKTVISLAEAETLREAVDRAAGATHASHSTQTSIADVVAEIPACDFPSCAYLLNALDIITTVHDRLLNADRQWSM